MNKERLALGAVLAQNFLLFPIIGVFVQKLLALGGGGCGEHDPKSEARLVKRSLSQPKQLEQAKQQKKGVVTHSLYCCRSSYLPR
ncbi:hypothetical protein NIES2130_32095 [Scytonema sp. HK-05]|nr:hypothetical protein NIES2130_32095 [Scytonema sp. HK-05]